MMTGLVIGMLTGITVWWLLVQRLKTKPWTERGVVAASQDDLTSSAPHVGLWVFLGVVTSLFLVFTGAYIMRKDHGHGGGMHEWVPVDDPSLLWLNTGLLVLASLSMQLSRGAASREDTGALRNYFVAAAALSVLFLLGQAWAWQMLAATGRYTVQTPAYTFFILLTGIHGLHLLGGLLVLGRVAARIRRAAGVSAGAGADAHLARAALSDVRRELKVSVELCTTYWHFLLLVWLGLLLLLLST